MSADEPMSGLSSEEVRAAVRAVLRDLLPTLEAGRTPVGDHPEHVALHTDADLDAFVRRLAGLCADPDRRAAFQDGRHGFRLAATGRQGSTSAGPPGSTAAGGDVVRIEKGVVTERIVGQAAADGARLVLGRAAVLTPLARDKARSLGVAIDKERS